MRSLTDIAGLAGETADYAQFTPPARPRPDATR